MNPYHALMVAEALEAALTGRHAEGEALLKLIAGANDDPAYVFYLLGHVQYRLRRYEEAVIALGVSVGIEPNQGSAQNDLAATLFALGREAEAVPAIERALTARPDLAEAEETYSIELLRTGRFREGWRHYEARMRSAVGGAFRRDFPQPQWTGAQDLAGRTILLHAEQGAGDTFQFVRYAPLAAARGATVLLEAYSAMLSALHGLAGVSALIGRGDTLPPFDMHCPLLSLPLAFGTELETVPADVPYLSPAQEKLQAWRAVLGPRAGRRVGVVFSGNPAHPDDARRSIPLIQFARLLAPADDREFHILQNDIREADRFALELLPHVRDHSSLITDFADTAALISLMDVVISVDTAVAHLAGALGWPVWTLLPSRADWRWMNEREDSPWYPTMWLIRQKRAGDWESVLDETAGRLDELLR